MLGRQAIVVGAGMGGLTAARVLADHFERVLVLERDALPADAHDRAGIPQGKHVHLLLAGGQQALSALFPGFEDDLVKAGAVPMRVGLDMRVERIGYDPFPQRDLGLVAYAMSRPLLEVTLRRRVLACPAITLRQDCRVQAFESRDGRVTGVRLAGESVGADLVVDASGRGTLTLDALAAMGRARPDETTIGVDLHYATAVFEIPHDAPGDWKGVFTFPGPSGAGALMLPLEDERWILTAAGRHRVRPPGDEDGFMAYVQKLRTKTIFNALRHAKRVGEIHRFGFTDSTLRHYERLTDFPAGLLPLGDAVCRFNPVHGQGMTVAAQESRALGRLLAQRPPGALDGLAPAFFAEAAALIETPWMSAAVPDFIHPETRGERPADFEQLLRIGFALGKLAAQDPAVHRLTAEVQNLVKPRSAYQDPALVQRVMEVMGK